MPSYADYRRPGKAWVIINGKIFPCNKAAIEALFDQIAQWRDAPSNTASASTDA